MGGFKKEEDRVTSCNGKTMRLMYSKFEIFE